MKCIGCNAILPFMEAEPKSFDCIFCDRKQYPEAIDLLSQPTLGFVNEVRPGQIALTEKISDNLRDGNAAMYEAGTGVGKSFAYLLPAILEGKRIIISTAKTSLQSQLVEKDLPYIQKRLRELGHPKGDFTFFSAYGKARYACYLKAKREKENTKDWPRYEKFFKQSEYGRFEEANKLHLKIDNNLNAEDCVGIECRYYKSECGYVAARKEMLASNVVVTNNWLLGYHYRLRQEMPHFLLLGEFEHVIVDEAHKIEDGIRSAYTHSTTLHYIDLLKKQFDKLQDAAEKRVELPELTALEPVWKSTFKELDFIHRTGTNDLTDKAVELIRDTIEGMNHIGDKLLDPAYLANVFTQSTAGTRALLLKRYLALPSPEVDPAALGTITAPATPEVLSAHAGFPTFEDDQARFIALDKLLASIRACQTTLEFVMKSPPNRTWCLDTTMYKGQRNFVLMSMPINIGAYLPEKHITYLSATLALENKFDAFAERVGLRHKKYDSAVFESPFDLKKQAYLFVPKPETMPDPTKPDPDPNNKEGLVGYRDALAEHVYQLLYASQGDAFVLFSAKTDLEHVKTYVHSKMYPYPIFAQGDFTSEAALIQFRNTPQATLFGLKSFWEGVDIPGNKLFLVIISKLPFPRKGDPIVKAKEAKYEENAGRDGAGFPHVSLPEMLFELRQGVGRLIRTQTDRGMIAILDSRVHSKSYGDRVKNMLGMRIHTDLEKVCRGLATRHAGKSTDRSSEP